MGIPIGHTRWVIADGYIPAWSHGPEPEMTSHEGLSILNTADRDVELRITIYFTDREPAGPYLITVDARRTNHVRMNLLKDPEPIPRGTPYSCLVEADGPVVVQHTRLDSRQAENAVFSTIAFAG
jgi:hypothetical protein